MVDKLTHEVMQESPWSMMFADDIVICGQNRWKIICRGGGLHSKEEEWKSASEDFAIFKST